MSFRLTCLLKIARKNPRWRRAGPCSVIVMLLSFSTGARAQQAHAQLSASSCIEGATVVPLLGGNGDSPIIPVKAGSSPAAMFVSPAFSHILVHDHDRIWFPQGPAQQVVAQDGNRVIAEHTEIDSLTIGAVSLPMVPALLLDGEAKHSADGLPVLGIIGRDILAHVEVLLDVPHRTLALFQWSRRKGCGETPAPIFTGDVYTVPMDSDAGIQVRIGPASARLRLDPDLAVSVLPRPDAHAAGVSDEILSHDPRVTARYVSIQAGARHRFPTVTIGAESLSGFDFVIEDSIRNGALGENFFEGVVALLDFPHGRFIFQPTDDRNDAPVLHLHFDQSRQGYTAVREQQGKPDHQ
ncbi:hypothetical protein GOB93_10570 [Acetobacter musti]|uniref:Uncharacterized protein n=1 Tax=Acetobacter musti TaxID=864732 RepID=A0ABX0JNP6_9PROT|nr:hypothetical protein [Acetobacter musti]NHN85081.1 hypothetical protein [Acetobacter musti]